MGAAIQKHMWLVSGVGRDDNGPSADAPRHKSTGLGHFRYVPGIKPGAVEDLAALPFEDLWFREHTTIDPEKTVVAIVDNEIPCLAAFHSHPPVAETIWRKSR